MIVLLLVVVVIRFSAHLLGKKTREERDQLTAEGESKDDSDRPPQHCTVPANADIHVQRLCFSFVGIGNGKGAFA